MTNTDALTAPSENTDTLDAQIGRRVHQLMWDRAITQTAFANVIRMDQSSVAKRLRGKLGWSATQVKQAADVLRTSVAYLYGETEDSNPVGPTGLEPMTSTV
jgi:BetR domain